MRRPEVDKAIWGEAEPVMRFVLALDARNAELTASVFSADATLWTPDGAEHRGRDAIRDHYAAAVARRSETRHLLSNIVRVPGADGRERSTWYALIVMEQPAPNARHELMTGVYEFEIDPAHDGDGPITSMRLTIDGRFGLVAQ